MADILCPHFEDHAIEPEGYIQWHTWAAQMGKTHHQSKCAGCGLFKIWTPKRATPPERTDNDRNS